MMRNLLKIFAKNTLKATILYCPFCASPKTKYHGLVQKDGKNSKTDNYSITCLACGASGNVQEVWLKAPEKAL